MNDELAHYGVLGMKWGVRRYRNYNGSYTKKGVARYDKAQSEYDTVKNKRKIGTATRADVRKAKRNLNYAYKKLKTDKKADQGKELYAKGKTITGNSAKTMTTEALIVAGGNIVAATLANLGNLRLASISGAVISVGGTTANAILAAKAHNENAKLRAYYAHH